MAKEIYIDENGNENLVSGTINNASLLPISANDPTDTKSYIDSGLGGKQDTITLSNGVVTWNTTNVSGNAYRNVWYKYGRVVVAHLEFTPISGKVANANVICSNLPKPQTNYNCFGDNEQQFIIDVDGNLVWYFPTDTATLNRWDLNITYISQS